MLTSDSTTVLVTFLRSERLSPQSSSCPWLNLVKTIRCTRFSNFSFVGSLMVRDAASTASTIIMIPVSRVRGFMPG